MTDRQHERDDEFYADVDADRHWLADATALDDDDREVLIVDAPPPHPRVVERPYERWKSRPRPSR